MNSLVKVGLVAVVGLGVLGYLHFSQQSPSHQTANVPGEKAHGPELADKSETDTFKVGFLPVT